MRSRKDHLITKDEVYRHAESWLSEKLSLKCTGRKCTTSVVFQVLLIAAARVVSVLAACRDLADAPCSRSVFNALSAGLPEIGKLEKQLNRSLCHKVPKALLRKARILAIDLTLIPYHGQPASDKKEIYRSKPKSGTSHFHAYATAAVVHKGYRYTLALMRVEYGVGMKEVVQKLVQLVRRQGVKIRYLLLDKGFYSVSVLSYLKRANIGYIVPIVPRGRRKKDKNAPPSAMRKLLKKNNGYYRQIITGRDGKRKKARLKINVCVASKDYVEEKTGKKRRKKLLFAISKVRRTWKEIRELYRKRFGIETTYRQMNEARIKTCTRDPRLRLLFVGIALILRNVWVWIHFTLAKHKDREEPQLFLELLRLEEMLLWITQIVQQALGAHKTQGIKYESYQRLVAKR
ncbi:MAG: ISH3 family transposase [Candidatus Binatia bacterium]